MSRLRDPKTADPWQVPASAADPRAVAALQVMPYKPLSIFGGQRALSDRWLITVYSSACYDGSAASDRALVASLAASRDEVFTPSFPGDQTDKYAASLKRTPGEELRMVALQKVASAGPSEGDSPSRYAAFVNFAGEIVPLSARYTWLVGRLFGGWDVATQSRPATPVLFWRGARCVAMVAPVGLDEGADFETLGGQTPVPPPITPLYEGPPLPQEEIHAASPELAAQTAALDAHTRAVVSALGGFHDGFGFIVPTRIGLVRFLSIPPAERWGDWRINLRFDEPLRARAAKIGRYQEGFGNRWDQWFRSASEAGAWLAREMGPLLRLPPALQPPLKLLRLIEPTLSQYKQFLPVWREGRWSVGEPHAAGGPRVLRGGYPFREWASWRAMQLNAARALMPPRPR